MQPSDNIQLPDALATDSASQAALDYARVEQLIHYLEAHFRDQPDLRTLADEAGLSEFHLQRLFSRWAGISPKRFVQYLTASYARQRLADSASVLDAAYDAGLSSPGRLHDLTVNIYAMSPGELKRGGAGLRITYGYHPTPFGECLLGTTARGVCALMFVLEGDRAAALAEVRRDWPGVALHENPDLTAPIAARIFSPGGGDDPLALHVNGTNFQVRVWEALLRIPSGALVTYGQIAAHLGQPTASRAVGSAVGRNRISYLIPCHRVIRSSGVIGERDYRWAGARKKALIGWEAAQVSAS